MTLQTLEYFIAVAQYRNFTKAAEACHVTQPALSRAIRTLEEELGCSLLIRAGRTAALTPEGGGEAKPAAPAGRVCHARLPEGFYAEAVWGKGFCTSLPH